MQLKATLSTSILFCIAAGSLLAQAQSRQIQGYLGTSLFPSASQNELLAGLKTGFTVGAGVSKTIGHAFVFNPNLEFTASSKEHFTFSLLSIHNNLKFYPWLTSKFRPYVMVIGNISFMNLHQAEYQTTVNPDPSYSVDDASNIPVSEVTYREPDLKLRFAPIIGVGAGFGVDVPVRLKIVPFIQYSFVSYFSKSSGLINDNFKNNTNNLSAQNISVGVRYNLYQKIKK